MTRGASEVTKLLWESVCQEVHDKVYFSQGSPSRRLEKWDCRTGGAAGVVVSRKKILTVGTRCPPVTPSYYIVGTRRTKRKGPYLRDGTLSRPSPLVRRITTGRRLEDGKFTFLRDQDTRWERTLSRRCYSPIPPTLYGRQGGRTIFFLKSA